MATIQVEGGSPMSPKEKLMVIQTYYVVTVYLCSDDRFMHFQHKSYKWHLDEMYHQLKDTMWESVNVINL